MMCRCVGVYVCMRVCVYVTVCVSGCVCVNWDRHRTSTRKGALDYDPEVEHSRVGHSITSPQYVCVLMCVYVFVCVCLCVCVCMCLYVSGAVQIRQFTFFSRTITPWMPLKLKLKRQQMSTNVWQWMPLRLKLKDNDCQGMPLRLKLEQGQKIRNDRQWWTVVPKIMILNINQRFWRHKCCLGVVWKQHDKSMTNWLNNDRFWDAKTFQNVVRVIVFMVFSVYGQNEI